MKLFYMPGACSLAPHIAFREAGLPVELVQIDRSKKTGSGDDYWAINPKGSVPAVKLDDGQVLTEAAVIQQYIADKVPAKKLHRRPARRSAIGSRSGSTTSRARCTRASGSSSIRRCRTITGTP
jgi:glutathione S-transferase